MLVVRSFSSKLLEPLAKRSEPVENHNSARIAGLRRWVTQLITLMDAGHIIIVVAQGVPMVSRCRAKESEDTVHSNQVGMTNALETDSNLEGVF